MKGVRNRGRDYVFTPRDLLDIAVRASVDQALSRLVKAGQLRRLAHGLYDYPKFHPQLGALSPSPDTVAQALTRETGSHAQIAGARARNAFGLSTQVAAKSSYLTDGPLRRVVVGKRVVALRHASPKHLVAPGSVAGTLMQALRHVGLAGAADGAQVAGQRLSADDRKLLAANSVHAPAWMQPALASIVSPAAADVVGEGRATSGARSAASPRISSCPSIASCSAT